jgi:uncharacterized protein (TIGR04255 family)
VSLPEYERPPVHEVVLGVHFKAIERFGGPYIGLLWQEFRSQFGKLQEQMPLSFRLERFGLPEPPQPPKLELLDNVAPRIWFVNDQETQLLQAQQDWFSHNWRKLKDDDEYPRYARLRASFHDELEKLIVFLEREHLGKLEPLQCEVTYVNYILMDNGEALGDLLTVFKPDFSDEFLKKPENANLSLRFVIPEADKPIGRLHIVAEPVVMLKTRASGFQLTLTARGKPAGDDPAAIFSLLDKGHEWIVRGFTSITTTNMHEKWGRTQ